jgi:hypothetical protein
MIDFASGRRSSPRVLEHEQAPVWCPPLAVGDQFGGAPAELLVEFDVPPPYVKIPRDNIPG